MSTTSLDNLICELCGAELTVDSSGECVCTKCGFVLCRFPTLTERWDVTDDTKNRGAPISKIPRPQVLIGYNKKDVGETAIMWGRLRKVNDRAVAQNSLNHNMSVALSSLAVLKDSLNIPTVVCQTAISLYRKVVSSGYVRGRSIYTTLCTTIYASYRIHDQPISLKGFCEKVRIQHTIIGSCYFALRNAGIIPKTEDNRVLLLISKAVMKFNMSGDIELISRQIYTALCSNHTSSGRSPLTLAGAILYISCKLLGTELTQKDLAVCCDVTEVSLRNNTREIMKRVDIIVEI